MSKTNKKNKVIVIIGPTGSGKTGLAVKLAYKYSGEVISADSRQVFRGMDIGTGKDLLEYSFSVKPRGAKRAKTVKIPYHLIDVVNPNTEFNLVKFYKKANIAIKDIIKRERLPIVAGGTGLYSQALVDGYDLNSVKADMKLREKLEKISVDKLYQKLLKLDSKFAKEIHASDQKNKRRLIRYIEIVKNGSSSLVSRKKEVDYEFLVLKITWPRELLRKRIYKRLIVRLEKEDMIGEVERLHKENKVSWKRLENFGLEYKYISYFLKGEMGYTEMVEKLNIAIRQFAKRQMSWYKRWENQGTEIKWVKNYSESDKHIRDFLKK